MTNSKIKKIAEESVRRIKFSPWEDRWVGDFDGDTNTKGEAISKEMEWLKSNKELENNESN
jgi:hypothetical protein